MSKKKNMCIETLQKKQNASRRFSTGGAAHTKALGSVILGTAGEKKAVRPVVAEPGRPVEPSLPTTPKRQKSFALLIEFS